MENGSFPLWYYSIITTNLSSINGSSWNQSLASYLPPYPDSTFTTKKLMVFLLYTVLFILSLTGNVSTLFVLRSKLRSVSRTQRSLNALLLQLCVSDLSIACFNLLAQAIWLRTGQFMAGNSMCKILKTIQAFTLNLSTYTVVLISVDRVLAVRKPIYHLHSWKRHLKTSIVASWLASLLLALPQAYLFSVERGPWQRDYYQCIVEKPEGIQVISFCTSLLILFIIPLVLMLFNYGLLIRVIARKSRQYNMPAAALAIPGSAQPSLHDPHSSGLHPDGGLTETATLQTNHSDPRSNCHVHYRPALMERAKIRSLQLAATIVIVFVIFWSPYWVLGSIILMFNNRPPILVSIAQWFSFLSSANSVINPIIYGYFNSRLVGMCCCWKSSGQRYVLVISWRRPNLIR